ncbi:MAG: putative transcriptional regulatory protein [Alphaproteobacteria bacterium MarineAlpha5_Bin11]|nr:YebC/PmpR family DNA-binding transcriptional regulator [Pelagibacteraceae bacterium]PPR43843.1 MAG: putative transcriptional regulatory protein [Alphaproteobacteria bacterium MarineAlpha5_Bin11]|tara:strand:+ start:14532 stop:15281 length:750 start_codon:yes stop_codon:yes gene_type:complete
MAGHSKFKNIMHRKGAQDRVRAKLFSKLGREISVAVKIGGSEIDKNIRLRSAVSAAKSSNMPKENISRAISKGLGNDPDSNYEEVRYEGYGPAGTAIIVEGLTNNKNRTASEIRTTFSKNGGSLGENGSVSYNFRKFGNITFSKSNINEDEVINFSIENGLEDFDIDDQNFSIFCEVSDFHKIINKFVDKFKEPDSTQLVWRSENSVFLELDSAQKNIKLINDLEENDDVQNVFSNFEVDESVIKKLIT